jgi:hypothetical protein
MNIRKRIGKTAQPWGFLPPAAPCPPALRRRTRRFPIRQERCRRRADGGAARIFMTAMAAAKSAWDRLSYSQRTSIRSADMNNLACLQNHKALMWVGGKTTRSSPMTAPCSSQAWEMGTANKLFSVCER